MTTYTQQLQDIFNDYEKAGMPMPATAKNVAAWAISNNRWKPKPADVIAQCAGDLAKALRDEYRTDKYGRRYRAKHAVRFKSEDDGKQHSFWADIDTAPRDHMQSAFAQRRKQVVGDCYQLKTDVDCYNDKNQKEEPINLILDFTEDVKEIQEVDKAS